MQNRREFVIYENGEEPCLAYTSINFLVNDIGSKPYVETVELREGERVFSREEIREIMENLKENVQLFGVEVIDELVGELFPADKEKRCTGF